MHPYSIHQLSKSVKWARFTGGGGDRLDKQHSSGKLSARETPGSAGLAMEAVAKERMRELERAAQPVETSW
jgi:hypothetical protein